VLPKELLRKAGVKKKKMATVIEESVETFGIEDWGQGYFGVSRDGNLVVHPLEGDPRAADVKQIIDDLARRGFKAPILLRFPQIIANQVKKLYRAFQNSIAEFGYKGQHTADVASGIRIEHARWFFRIAGDLTAQQLIDGLKASGATDSEADRFARALVARIGQLEKV